MTPNPPATNQAALLRWAADRLDADMERFFSEWPDEPRNSPYALGRKDASSELRRLAAVSVPPPAPRADDLRWAADRLADEIMRGARFSHEDARQPGLAESVMLLRRWADEAGEQQNETPEARP